MAVEQVARWPWNAWPDERGLGGRMVWNPHFEKGGGVKAVPIEAADAFFVTSLFLLQIRKISPWLDASSAIALVRSTMHMQQAT